MTSAATLSRTRSPSDGPVFLLQWSDPSGASSNDYDLYLFNQRRTRIVAASTNTQSGSQDPFELIPSSVNDTNRG